MKVEEYEVNKEKEYQEVGNKSEVKKERIEGKIHRKYEVAKTPYQRVIESKEVSEKQRQELKKIYESLNPAELKRAIDRKLDPPLFYWRRMDSKRYPGCPRQTRDL